MNNLIHNNLCSLLKGLHPFPLVFPLVYFLSFLSLRSKISKSCKRDPNVFSVNKQPDFVTLPLRLIYVNKLCSYWLPFLIPSVETETLLISERAKLQCCQTFGCRIITLKSNELKMDCLLCTNHCVSGTTHHTP